MEAQLAALWDYYEKHGPEIVWRIVSSLLVLAIFWAVGVMAQKAILRVCAARAVGLDLTYFLSRAAKISLGAFGAVTALGTLGVDVTALVAGLGLVGFALGFALRDMISNALAGVLILLYKPYQRNDRITVTDLSGIVVEINLRYTVLAAEGARILIPNANLFTNPITVATAVAPATMSGTPEGEHGGQK